MPERLPTNFARYPLLLLATALAAGVVVCKFIEIPILVSAGTVVVCALIAWSRSSIAVFSLSLAFAALGAFCFQMEITNVRPDRLKVFYDEGRIASGENVFVEGTVTSGPEPTADGIVFAVHASSIESSATKVTSSGWSRIYVLANTDEHRAVLDQLNIGYGTRLRIECPLRREENFQNPGVFSQIEMLDQQGIDAVCTVKNPGSIAVIEHASFTPLQWIFDQRRGMIDGFRRLLDAPTAGVMIASLLGDKYFVDRETAEVFRDGGTFHILVISGLHITFIGGLALLAVGLFTNRRVWRFLIAAGFLWAYTLAVGAEIPVVRASLMFTILLFSQIVRRDGTLLNSLGLCGLILLVWRPQDLFTASFQLTFASVAAIVGIAFPLIEKLRAIGDWRPTSSTPFPPNVPDALKRLCEMLYWREDAWRVESKQNIWTAKFGKSPLLARVNAGSFRWLAVYLFEGLLVSAIVQLCLLPLSVYYFHRVSFSSVFLNLWVGVVLAIETFFAIAAVAVSFVSDTLAAPFAASADLFNRLLISVPSALMEVVSFSSRVPVYPGYGKLIYPLFSLSVAVVGILLFKWKPFDVKPRRPPLILITASTVSMLLASLIVFHPLSSPRAAGRLKVEFLDVGQGDAALLTFPSGETMLIDGGGRFSYGRDGDFDTDIPRIGERVVSEFLWEKGYSHVDSILATHADADHMQGLADVVRNFDVDVVYFARSEPDDPEFADLMKAISRRGVRSEIVGKGDSLAIGNTKVEVLHPVFDDSPNSLSNNDASLVIRITYGSRSVLFTGDIEQAGENSLLNDPALRADVVKVPHHGSKTSSTQAFINAADPEVAVISVGRRSTFGHPHAEVVTRWKDSGASVLTTGENGTIMISSDGEDLVVSTYKQKHER